MAGFHITLTGDGMALLAKCIAGQTLRFTAIGLGSGTLAGSADTQTALVAEEIRLPISKITQQDSRATIRAILSFQEICEGFFWREIGLYAQDTGTGQEVLYAYGNAGDKTDWVPGAGETTLTEKKINVTALVSTAENVTAVIDQSLVYATQEDLVGKADFDLGNVSNADFKAKADAALLGADGKIPAEVLPETDVSGAVSAGIQTHNADAQAHAELMTGKANQSDFAAHTGNTVAHLTAAERTAWNAKADQTALNSHVSNATAHLTAAEHTKWNAKGAPYRFTATIPTSGWTGSASAGYSITLAVSGLIENASAPPVIDVVQSTDTAAAKLQLQSWGNVSKIMVSTGSITVYCHEKLPGVNIPIQICGVKV